MGKNQVPKNPDYVIRVIAEALTKKRYSAGALALKIGRSRAWGYQLMKNEAQLTLQVLSKIAEILEINPASLLPSPDNPGRKESFEDYVRRLCDEQIAKKLDVEKPGV